MYERIYSLIISIHYGGQQFIFDHLPLGWAPGIFPRQNRSSNFEHSVFVLMKTQ